MPIYYVDTKLGETPNIGAVFKSIEKCKNLKKMLPYLVDILNTVLKIVFCKNSFHML